MALETVALGQLECIGELGDRPVSSAPERGVDGQRSRDRDAAGPLATFVADGEAGADPMRWNWPRRSIRSCLAMPRSTGFRLYWSKDFKGSWRTSRPTGSQAAGVSENILGLGQCKGEAS